MSLQTALTYINIGANFLNDKLAIPSKIIQNKLSLKTDSLPESFKTPLNFSTILAVAMFLIVSFANNLISNVIGILYPVLYGLYLINSQVTVAKINQNISSILSISLIDKLLTLNKYWLLFGILTLVETFFGFLLYLIPGFFYLKIMLIYTLIRDDFSLTNIIFGFLENQYAKSKFRPKIEKVIEEVNSKLGSETITTHN